MNIGNALFNAMASGTPLGPGQPSPTPSACPTSGAGAGGGSGAQPPTVTANASSHHLPAKRDAAYFREIINWIVGIGVLSLLGVVAVINFVTHQFGAFENRGIITFLISALLWVAFAVWASSWFYITVPEYIGWVTVDLLSGKKRIYPDASKGEGAGTYITLPTELKKKKNRIDLEGTTVPIDIVVSVSDGGRFKVSGSFRERPRLIWLDRYIGVDKSTIQTGFADAFVTPIARRIQKDDTGKPRDTVQALTVIGAIEAEIKTAFEGTASQPHDDELEKKWGVEFDNLFIKIEPTEETLKQLEKSLAATSLARGVKSLKDLKVPIEKATDAVLIDTEKMKKSVEAKEQTLKINLEGAGGKAVAHALEKIAENPAAASALGAALGAAIATKQSQKPRRGGGQNQPTT